MLPKNELAPEVTEGRKGFLHPTDIKGTAEKASIKFILRDFDDRKLDAYADLIEQTVKSALATFPHARYTLKRTEQYRNMKTVLDKFPQVVDLAAQAMKNCGIEPIMLPVRGGTDGSRLSFMGLPSPNIFTGEMALHSVQEYVSVQDMEKSLAVLLQLIQLWESTGK